MYIYRLWGKKNYELKRKVPKNVNSKYECGALATVQRKTSSKKKQKRINQSINLLKFPTTKV